MLDMAAGICYDKGEPRKMDNSKEAERRVAFNFGEPGIPERKAEINGKPEPSQAND